MTKRVTVLPYFPIAAYLSLIGFLRLGSGGFAPKGVLNHTTPMVLVIAWTLAVAVGGLLAVAGGLTGGTRTESSGLSLLLGGSVFYGAGVSYAEGRFDIATISVSVAIGLMCLFRLKILSDARKAQRLAGRIQEHDLQHERDEARHMSDGLSDPAHDTDTDAED